MNKETAMLLIDLFSMIATWALIIGIPVLFGWLIYKAIIGIIREIKKKD